MANPIMAYPMEGWQAGKDIQGFVYVCMCFVCVYVCVYVCVCVCVYVWALIACITDRYYWCLSNTLDQW